MEKILASILARKGAKTRNKVLRTIRPLFNAAVEQGAGGLDKSPVKSKPLKAVVDERATAKPEQVKALADAMPSRLALSVYLAAWCALRQGEALGLQCRDFIDLDTPPAYAPRGTPVESENQPTRLHHHQRQRRVHHLNPH